MKSYAVLAALGLSSVAADDEKIKIDIYCESEWRGCRDMVTNSLAYAYKQDGFLDMAEINWVPYGMAKETLVDDVWQFNCQFGIIECGFNLMESCGLNVLTDETMKFNFVNCIESNNSKGYQYEKTARACGTTLKITNIDDIITCFNGPDGNKYQHQYALETEAAAIKYSPWVVANGVHNQDINDKVYANVFAYVCQNYTGKTKAKGCVFEEGKQKTTPSAPLDDQYMNYRFEEMTLIESFLQ